MKKVLKFIIIVLVVLILILIINTIRNICIINKLKDISNQYFSDINSYKIYMKENTSATAEGIEEKIYSQSEQDIYYKDNKYLIKSKINGAEPEIKLQDKSDNEYEYTDFIDYLETMKIDSLRSQFDISIINFYVFSFIKEDQQNYIICPLNTMTFYYNKENGIVSKVEREDGFIFQEYVVEKNTVTDEDMNLEV